MIRKIAIDKNNNVLGFKYQFSPIEIDAEVNDDFLNEEIRTGLSYRFYVKDGVVYKKTDEELKAEPDYNEYMSLKRAEAYKQESDALFFKYQRGEVTEQDWLDKVQEIKDRYPKN
jgi:hypothetical protein